MKLMKAVVSVVMTVILLYESALFTSAAAFVQDARLENDCAVIGKVAYRLDGKIQQMDKMVFAEPEQFDCLYEVDENGVIDIEE